MDRRAFLALGIIPVAAMTASGGRAGETASGGTPGIPVPGNRLLFPDDAQFWFETQRAFGAVEYGGALFGEVLSTSSRIKSGDYDSWYEAWNETADRIAKEASDQFARGHRVSARDSYLRASGYYFTSEFFLHGNGSADRTRLSAIGRMLHKVRRPL